MRVTLKIQRFDPEKDRRPYYQSYQVEVDSRQRLVEVLETIKDHQDGTLTYRRSCGHGICGSCAMMINGMNRLACSTLVQDVKSPVITLEPLRSFPVIKDLVVNLSAFYDKLKRIKPYFINDQPAPVLERLQVPADRKKIDEATSCILCGCCTGSCPSYWADREYLGPAALFKSYRFVADSRDTAIRERLEIINDRNGTWRCHTIFNCIEACPKDLNIAEGIQHLKRAVIQNKI